MRAEWWRRRKKGKEAGLCYGGHVLIDNGHCFVVSTVVTQAYERAEPEAVLWMAEKIPGRQRVSLAAEMGYDQAEVVQGLRRMRITPHNARKQHSAVDAQTTR